MSDSEGEEKSEESAGDGSESEWGDEQNGGDAGESSGDEELEEELADLEPEEDAADSDAEKADLPGKKKRWVGLGIELGPELGCGVVGMMIAKVALLHHVAPGR